MEKRMLQKPVKLWTRIVLIVVSIVVAIVIVFLLFLAVLTIREFRPADTEFLAVQSAANGSGQISAGDSVSVMTWNIGYGALGENADFFMDGGSGVITADQEQVLENLRAINSQIQTIDPDIAFFQEVDIDSRRSHHIDELEALESSLPADSYTSVFATNYKVDFIPYPWPPLGKVDAGLLTCSRYEITESERLQLPCPFSWPLRLANLKRCLMVSRIPLAGTDRELVVINLHLEAYDSGEGKIAQTQMLRDVLEQEAAAGNYVIAGGDFNQIFSTVFDKYPYNPELWVPGRIDVEDFDSSWQFAVDADVPSCRSLDRPYAGADPEDFQYYLIDGFIVSDNLTIESIETQDLGFANSDHNPVVMKVLIN